MWITLYIHNLPTSVVCIRFTKAFNLYNLYFFFICSRLWRLIVNTPWILTGPFTVWPKLFCTIWDFSLCIDMGENFYSRKALQGLQCNVIKVFTYVYAERKVPHRYGANNLEQSVDRFVTPVGLWWSRVMTQQ